MKLSEKCCYKPQTDKQFPPTEDSLGYISGDTANVNRKNSSVLKWIRAPNLPIFKDKKVQLFQDDIEPSDIKQGQIGDCQLMAAIACVAEEPNRIQRLFKDQEVQRDDKNKWVHIVIDDQIPVMGKPGHERSKFAEPNGCELWVMLLEKAVAKLLGSYASLEGGQTMWGVSILTGDQVRIFKHIKTIKVWSEYHFLTNDDVTKPPKEQASCASKISEDDMFTTLEKQDKRESLMSVAWSNANNGLVTSHAQSIMQSITINNIRLLNIRNPWGKKSDYKGDWGDDSELWNLNPKIKKKINFKPLDDGSFWMSWSDVNEQALQLGLCDISLNLHTECKLRIKDEEKWCGPCGGCFFGMFTFFCCCRGCKYLQFGHESKEHIDQCYICNDDYQ